MEGVASWRARLRVYIAWNSPSVAYTTNKITMDKNRENYFTCKSRSKLTKSISTIRLYHLTLGSCVVNCTCLPNSAILATMFQCVCINIIHLVVSSHSLYIVIFLPVQEVVSLSSTISFFLRTSKICGICIDKAGEPEVIYK